MLHGQSQSGFDPLTWRVHQGGGWHQQQGKPPVQQCQTSPMRERQPAVVPVADGQSCPSLVPSAVKGRLAVHGQPGGLW